MERLKAIAREVGRKVRCYFVVVCDNVVWQGSTGMCGEDVPKGGLRVSVSLLCDVAILLCCCF